MTHGSIFLTSIGLSCHEVYENIRMLYSLGECRPVAIITTAAEAKEQNKYSQLAKQQFQDIGFDHIDFIDLEDDPTKDLSLYGIIYVCGGNTFKLLTYARTASFGASVLALLKRDGIYIGVSAGSIILGPSIAIAGKIAPDKNDVGITDYTGLMITDLIVLPHYTSDLEDQTIAFEQTYGVDVERLSNTQAILIKQEKKVLLG